MELVSANMMRESFALPMTRDRVRFNAFLIKSTVFHIGANLFGTISGQVEARLSRRWRLRLTDVGHGRYFEGASYYRVEREMKDADLRLTDDVQVPLSLPLSLRLPHPPTLPPSLSLGLSLALSLSLSLSLSRSLSLFL